jgi:hypothetical protein
MPRSFLTLLLSVMLMVSAAQVKTTLSVKVAVPPKIDGSLDDAAWQQVPIATDFITNSPVFGNPALKTEVKVVYDNSAIYIGAYIYDDPSQVRHQFTVRDDVNRNDVDYFSVFLDTYQDRQNAYQFQVTSRNVQSDARISPGFKPQFGVYGDLSWDAVWDSKVGFKKDGWVVEIKIPFSAIRFSRKDQQSWGIQFLRFTRRLNELSFWSAVNPSVDGFVNQFGNVKGLEHLLPPLRLSLSPYVSGGYRETPRLVQGTLYETLKSGGMDVKYGLSESFTLDATLVPDFGQVLSDNVVNNISPYEIQFRENRPFFTEGTELFNKAGIFYSRRIGRTPGLYDTINTKINDGDLGDYDVIKNPSVTRLYNAIKFSGRTRDNLGIGIFNAVTEQVNATLRNRTTGKDSSFVSEPLANYNIIVLDQALKNRSYITFTNTNVMRNGNKRDANVTALDLALYNKSNRYGFLLKPRYSKIFDSPGYDGFANHTEFGKISGKLQFSVSNDFMTAKYDPTDLGYLQAPNEFTNTASFSYNIYEPTKTFLNQGYGISALQSYLFQPFSYQKTQLDVFAFGVFRNFWDLKISTSIAPFWYNDFFELQTPRDLHLTPRLHLKRAPYYSFFADGSSDSRKRLYVIWSLGFAEGPLPNDPYYKLGLEARFRFSDRFSLDASYTRQYDNGQFGYAQFRDIMTDAPILARRTYTDITTVISGIYNFTPRMNITFRARHYWNRILNTDLYDVKPGGYWVERTDLVPSDYNNNYNAFNLDMFYTWDFRLGSRLIIGWKNWLGEDYGYFINGARFKSYIDNTQRVFATPHGNELTVRFIYYLDYQQFRKK